VNYRIIFAKISSCGPLKKLHPVTLVANNYTPLGQIEGTFYVATKPSVLCVLACNVWLCKSWKKIPFRGICKTRCYKTQFLWNKSGSSDFVLSLLFRVTYRSRAVSCTWLTLKMRVFWDAAPCNLVAVDPRFIYSYCLHRYGNESSPWWRRH